MKKRKMRRKRKKRRRRGGGRGRGGGRRRRGNTEEGKPQRQQVEKGELGEKVSFGKMRRRRSCKTMRMRSRRS